MCSLVLLLLTLLVRKLNYATDEASHVKNSDATFIRPLATKPKTLDWGYHLISLLSFTDWLVHLIPYGFQRLR